MHKLCELFSFTTQTVCTHKERNTHTHSFRQIPKAVHTDDSVLEVLIIVETGICALALFPVPQLSIYGRRNTL